MAPGPRVRVTSVGVREHESGRFSEVGMGLLSPGVRTWFLLPSSFTCRAARTRSLYSFPGRTLGRPLAL